MLVQAVMLLTYKHNVHDSVHSQGYWLL